MVTIRTGFVLFASHFASLIFAHLCLIIAFHICTVSIEMKVTGNFLKVPEDFKFYHSMDHHIISLEFFVCFNYVLFGGCIQRCSRFTHPLCSGIELPYVVPGINFRPAVCRAKAQPTKLPFWSLSFVFILKIFLQVHIL